MARPEKFDYDSDDFYDEILALSMQGLTDAEIADALETKFGTSLSPEAFCSMKNGTYKRWTKKENKTRSERLVKVLARGRRKINSIVRGTFLKAALGGRKIKNKSTVKRKLRTPDGYTTDDEEIQSTETENEMPPNIQALATWLYHHDAEWRKIQRKEDEEEDMENAGGITIDKWLKDNEE